ncbi:MAG: hypothetical protein HZY76_14575 [Anaerolineae bacterium]|nr:MAG: hypothetical protein HZY76_14575 [Anaerolineae bacterium]
MSSNTNKLLAGALLAGMGILTGQATLIATAGGVGVNWLAEGLAGLWPTLGGRPSDPLAKAYAAAIRDAVDKLEADYIRTVTHAPTARPSVWWPPAPSRSPRPSFRGRGQRRCRAKRAGRRPGRAAPRPR